MEFETKQAIRNHKIFAAAMCGAFYGLTTHPSDKPQNGCLISEASMKKIKDIYKDVLKEREDLDKLLQE